MNRRPAAATLRPAPALALVAIAVAVGLGWPGPPARRAHAQGFFQQSPGALTRSHATLEGQSNCTQCHTDGKELSNAKCLGCHEHEDMAARIRSGRGFHVSEKVTGKQCWLCHTEHKGLGHDPLGWATIGGKERFDHAWTGFALTGGHVKVKCERCHTRKNKAGVQLHMGEDERCSACHRKDDPHKISQVNLARCDRCHGTKTWKQPLAPMDFDHDRDTGYELQAKHRDVACVKCHPGAVYSLPGSKDCVRCHDKENPHKGTLFGTKRCGECHGAAVEWKRIEFDHGRKTKFELDGAHGRAACGACHKAGVEKKPERACASCHPDPHGRRFDDVPACEACHGTADWARTSRFDHDRRTKFRLTGKHAQVDCRKCHRGKEPDKFERFAPTIVCMECHQHEGVHKRQFKSDQCLGCHKLPGVRQSREQAADRFHGLDSSFPLDGGHKDVPCAKCHPTKEDFSKTPKQCGPRCHPDKLHKGSLGPDCQRCHDGGRWPAVDFDHAKDARWKLVGEHLKVACLACHPQRLFKPVRSRCVDCHAEDDPHRGALGDRCESCHEPTARSTFDHARQSTFKLEGKHAEIKCAGCHKDVRFKPVPSACVGCHKDVHKGRFGRRCEPCHGVVDFKDVAQVHDVGAFSLGGSHDQVPCARCHRDDRPLKGTGEVCITCHRADDVHHNSLGPRCADCHSQTAFSPARFVHAQVGCDLRGVHRTLPCLDCHKAGNYVGLLPECVGCHRGDALRAGIVQAGGVEINHGEKFTCTTCHNPNFWVPGLKGGVRESVCR